MTAAYRHSAGQCHFCRVPVGWGCYCHGCEQFICDDCDALTPCGAKHAPDDHRAVSPMTDRPAGLVYAGRVRGRATAGDANETH